MISDVGAGLLLAPLMVLPFMHYDYAAKEITAGRYTVGGDLSGVFATHMPDHLSAGPAVFAFGFPAIVFYVIWMIVHSFASGRLWLAGTLATLVTVPVGYMAVVETFLSPADDVLAIVSAIAFAACVLAVIIEVALRFTLRRRPQRMENAPLPWGRLEP